jgi:type I restriction-modification system DNA methylase subunit
MSKHLNEIIGRLGYAGSEHLKYKDKNYNSSSLAAHTAKVLNSLSPFAAYLVDNEPFVLFFDELLSQDEQKELSRKIWNAQIPVAIFCGTSTVSIYNGCTINSETHFLTLADKIEFHTVEDIDENSPFSFWEITDQNFWKKYSTKFSGKKLNDSLLENLIYLTDVLNKDHEIPFATKITLRLIFIRYLIDRGVDLNYPGFTAGILASREALLSLLDNKSKLYALFAHLKEKFNGNLFELSDEEGPNDNLTKEALADIKDFLSANIQTSSGQPSLFDLYDFDIIPVELISNIYEILLGKEAREKDNAFYTPQYLVDYILDMTIDKYIEENETCRILDPSCGSGVFLVNSYRRMVEKKLGGKPYTDDNELLCSILTNNIYGIDLNQDAIDVAIFSLYLAVLDYRNPKTLEKQFQLPDLKKSNLLVCDFFDEDKLTRLQDVSFDFIIGNPPWGNKHGMHIDYCIKHGHKQYMQNNDTCHCFILRSKDFCIKNKNAVCCFVLKSKMLYMQKQPSKRFREFLLTDTKIINLIELSSVRKLVFKNADAPAIVLSYQFFNEGTPENRFEYISMKRNELFKLFNIIVVEKADIKNVQQKLLLENDWAWKTLVFGLTGDIDTILRLKATTKTFGEGINDQHPKLIKGTGVKYNDGDLKDASHLVGRPLLHSETSINHFVLFENNTSPFMKTRIDRPRNEALFQAPYCLVMQGPDMADYTMEAVYSETNFVFHEVVYAIKGLISQKAFLLNVVGLLNSKLYAYFNLMLGSFIGVDREKRQIGEVLSFPYIFSEDIAIQAEKIQELKKQEGNFVAGQDASDEIDALNRTIIEAFGLSGNEFVDYALSIQIPQLTGENTKDVNRKATMHDFEIYGKYFHNYLSEVFAYAGKHVQIIAYPTVAKHYSAFEVAILAEKPSDWLVIVNDNNDNRKAILAKLSAHKINEQFYSLKDVLYFEEDSFCIIKPSYYKNWHPAIARLDLMEATDQILSRKKGGE